MDPRPLHSRTGLADGRRRRGGVLLPSPSPDVPPQPRALSRAYRARLRLHETPGSHRGQRDRAGIPGANLTPRVARPAERLVMNGAPLFGATISDAGAAF